VSLAIAAQLQRLGIKANVVVNEWGTHLDKIKNRNTGDMFFLGWGPALHGQGTIHPLFLADQTYSSYGNNPILNDKIARAGTLLDAKARADAYAELQRLVRDVLGDRADVDVGVGEPRHERHALAVHVRHRPRERADLAARENVLDPVVLDDHRGAVSGLGPRAVDQEGVREYADGHCSDLRDVG